MQRLPGPFPARRSIAVPVLTMAVTAAFRTNCGCTTFFAIAAGPRGISTSLPVMGFFSWYLLFLMVGVQWMQGKFH
jgi:hypothetical protein